MEGLGAVPEIKVLATEEMRKLTNNEADRIQRGLCECRRVERARSFPGGERAIDSVEKGCMRQPIVSTLGGAQ